MTDDKSFTLLLQTYVRQAARCTFAFGLICFLAPFAYQICSTFLPTSFEWPIGSADNVIRTQQNNYIVPHVPSGRVQVYDANFQFIRGWKVETSGGTFKILPFNESRQQFEVVTARNHMKYVFDLTGQEMTREKYPSGQYDSFPKAGGSIAIPTPLWMMPLSHPFNAWIIAVMGFLILKLSSLRRLKGP